MAQFFKETDSFEQKMYNSAKPAFDEVDFQKDLYFDGAYSNYELGSMVYDTNRAPLTNAIVRSIFREAYEEIIQAFIVLGTYDAYYAVFQKIFGDDVIVEFAVPGPGQLWIDVIASGIELSDFASRYIENNEYLFDEIIDDEGDNIAFQTVKGFQTEYELSQMLHEMIPDGIYPTISLTIGDA